MGISKTNTEVANQANLANSSSSAIEQEITKVQQQIGEYQELRDAIINKRARLPTGNPHQSILNRYLVASQEQTQETADEPFLSQINQSIANLESSIASLKIQQAGIGSVATYDNSLATKIRCAGGPPQSALSLYSGSHLGGRALARVKRALPKKKRPLKGLFCWTAGVD